MYKTLMICPWETYILGQKKDLLSPGPPSVRGSPHPQPLPASPAPRELTLTPSPLHTGLQAARSRAHQLPLLLGTLPPLHFYHRLWETSSDGFFFSPHRVSPDHLIETSTTQYLSLDVRIICLCHCFPHWTMISPGKGKVLIYLSIFQA